VGKNARKMGEKYSTKKSRTLSGFTSGSMSKRISFHSAERKVAWSFSDSADRSRRGARFATVPFPVPVFPPEQKEALALLQAAKA
jgi:hypothetical protein